MILSKKYFLFFFTILIICNVLVAQDEKKKEKCVRQGNFIVDASYGFPFLLGEYIDQVPHKPTGLTSMKTMNYIGRVEYLIGDFLGMGLEYAYASVNAQYKDASNENTYNISISQHRGLFKFNGHFLTTKRLDPYGGLGFGFKRLVIQSGNIDDQHSISTLTSSIKGFPMALRLGLGLHYYPVKHVGIGVEVGIGGPIVQGGVSIKI